LNRLLDEGMAASQVEYAESRQQIQVAGTAGIPQVGAFPAGICLVEANDGLNAGQAGVDETLVQGILFPLPVGSELGHGEGHSKFLESWCAARPCAFSRKAAAVHYCRRPTAAAGILG